MQEELDAREFEATSGGGMVTAKVNGKRELLAISIKPEAVDPDDVEMLEDMVTGGPSTRPCAPRRRRSSAKWAN